MQISRTSLSLSGLFTAVAVITLTWASQLSGQQSTTPQPVAEGVSVTIHVVDADTNDIIPGVSLALISGSPAVEIPFRTDETGVARLENVPPAVHRIVTRNDGFGVETGAGSRLIIGEASGSLEKTVRLWKAAIVEGTVEDPDGNPLESVGVELMREVWYAGVRQVDTTGRSVRTDADGRFEFRGILAGTYFLRASLATREPVESDGVPALGVPYAKMPEALRFANTLYPSALAVEAAAALNILAGVNQRGLRLVMQRAEFYSVSGRVEGMPDNVVDPVVDIYPLSGVDSPFKLFYTPVEFGRARVAMAADGSFMIPNLQNGPYLLELNSESETLRGRMRVTVRDGDISDLRFLTLEAWPFTMRYQYADGTTPEVTAAQLRTFTPGSGLTYYGARSQDRSTISIEAMEPGVYRLIPSATLGVTEKVSIGGREFTGGYFEFAAPGATDVVVTLSRDAATVAGTVELLDPDEVVVGKVTMMPEPLTILSSQDIREATLGDQGEYIFEDAEPGKFRLCAWNDEGIRANEILNSPRFSQRLAGACEVVEVGEDGVEEVRLKQLNTRSFQ